MWTEGRTLHPCRGFVCAPLPSLGVCRKHKRNTFLLPPNKKKKKSASHWLNIWQPTELWPCLTKALPLHTGAASKKHPIFFLLSHSPKVYPVLGVIVSFEFVTRYEDGTEFFPMEADVCSEDTEAYVTNLSYYHLVPFETDILEWGTDGHRHTLSLRNTLSWMELCNGEHFCSSK